MNILDFLPAMQMNWNFSLANFSRVDGMLLKHSFNLFLCFYIEKLYVIMRKDTQWIWITESASLRNRHEMCNEWHRQTSESTRTIYVLVLIMYLYDFLSTIYYVCIRWEFRIKFHVPRCILYYMFVWKGQKLLPFICFSWLSGSDWNYFHLNVR